MVYTLAPHMDTKEVLAGLAGRCEDCMVQSDWHNARYKCNRLCCPNIDSRCLVGAVRLIDTIRDCTQPKLFGALERVVADPQHMSDTCISNLVKNMVLK